VLVLDETLLRQFPPLRAAWALRGEQAQVPITGENARRVLFGAINPRTGHRVVLQRPSMRQEDFQAFLRLLRARYPGRPLYLLLDKASCHTAAKSEALAARLDIHLLLLPKQWSELNSMDHLWRALKQYISANRQYPSVDAQAQHAQDWVLGLSDHQALRKAGVLAASGRSEKAPCALSTGRAIRARGGGTAAALGARSTGAGDWRPRIAPLPSASVRERAPLPKFSGRANGRGALYGLGSPSVRRGIAADPGAHSTGAELSRIVLGVSDARALSIVGTGLAGARLGSIRRGRVLQGRQAAEQSAEWPTRAQFHGPGSPSARIGSAAALRVLNGRAERRVSEPWHVPHSPEASRVRRWRARQTVQQSPRDHGCTLDCRAFMRLTVPGRSPLARTLCGVVRRLSGSASVRLDPPAST
jgi:transposase